MWILTMDEELLNIEFVRRIYKMDGKDWVGVYAEIHDENNPRIADFFDDARVIRATNLILDISKFYARGVISAVVDGDGTLIEWGDDTR